jgi:hypothetical protein
VRERRRRRRRRRRHHLGSIKSAIVMKGWEKNGTIIPEPEKVIR